MLQIKNVIRLKAITIIVNMSMHGKKQLLFNHICDSLGVTKVSADEFDYRHTSVVGVKALTWVIFHPQGRTSFRWH